MQDNVQTTPQHTSRQRRGFVISEVVAFSNLPGMLIPFPEDAENGPPFVVLVAGGVLGVVTMGLLLQWWRTGARRPVRAAAVLLAVLALLALPGLIAPGVPAWVRVMCGVYVLATVAGLSMIFRSDVRPQAAVQL